MFKVEETFLLAPLTCPPNPFTLDNYLKCTILNLSVNYFQVVGLN